MIHIAICCILLGVLHFCCFGAMLVPRYSIKKTVAIYAVSAISFSLLAILVRILLYDQSLLALTIGFTGTMLGSFVVFYITSADPPCKKVFLFVHYSNAFCIFCGITIILRRMIFSAVPMVWGIYISLLVLSTLCIGMALAYRKFLRPTFLTISDRNKKGWHAITMVGVLFLAIFCVLVTICRANIHSTQYMLAFAADVVLYIAGLRVTFSLILYIRDETKSDLMALKVDYLQRQLDIAIKNERKEKTIRHDFRHHMQNLAVMLEADQVDTALAYISEYGESLDHLKSKRFCPHMIVNAILNNYAGRAEQAGIRFSAAADIPRECPVADLDFVAILSNLLENALNGCRKDKSCLEIEVNIRTVGDKIVILCSNPCCQEFELEEHMVKQKGIGIESILATAEKYSGDVRYEKQDGMLTACVILKI